MKTVKSSKLFPDMKGMPCTVQGCTNKREESLSNYCPLHTLAFLKNVDPESAQFYLKRHPELMKSL